MPAARPILSSRPTVLARTGRRLLRTQLARAEGEQKGGGTVSQVADHPRSCATLARLGERGARGGGLWGVPGWGRVGAGQAGAQTLLRPSLQSGWRGRGGTWAHGAHLPPSRTPLCLYITRGQRGRTRRGDTPRGPSLIGRKRGRAPRSPFCASHRRQKPKRGEERTFRALRCVPCHRNQTRNPLTLDRTEPITFAWLSVTASTS